MTDICNSDILLLHVEDNELDAIALQRAFGKLGITNPMQRAKDGIEALEKLRHAETSPEPSPAQTVILLDINMPRMNGHEFLEELRNDPLLKKTPVFVLTTSSQPADVSKAYDHNVAGYIVKPIGSSKLIERMERWRQFLSIVEFPTAS